MSKQQTVWEHLFAAPHRSLFLAGTLQGVLTLLWWVFDLASRYAIVGSATNWSITPVWAHAFMMIYSFFPFFIFGFLFTTYPSWINSEKIKPHEYKTTSLLMVLGVVLFYLGLLTHKVIIIIGIEIMVAGWGFATYLLFRILLITPAQDKRHAGAISMALFMGMLGMASYLFWLVTEVPALLDFARYAGIWFFLLPIVLTVSHRMIPFFSSRVLENYKIFRPFWMLWLMLVCIFTHGCLLWLEMNAYLWIFDFPLALCAFYLSYRWGFLRSFQVSLLAVLHISFAWLSVSMVLYGAQSLVYMLSGNLLFGLAPIHALGIGYFSGMILAMASRVTLGHSGQPLELDRFTWLLFLGFQTAALLRILADVVTTIGPMLYIAAGLAWLVCFTIWAFKFAPIYWHQRVDGKPG